MNRRRKQKRGLLICLSLLVLCSGCEQRAQEGAEDPIQTSGEQRKQAISEESERLAEGYRDIYEAAAREECLDTLEVQEEIINHIGNAGYAAVDRDDQINMVQYEQAEDFCENAQKGQHDEVTIFSVMNEGGFVRYDMETEGGSIDVTVSTLKWENGEPLVYYYQEFTAHSWRYTEKGYLFLEEYHPPGYDGPPGEIGFRVKPLDETCRELNRRYVYPVGYERNNLLITDWEEQDYGELDFYDLYEKLYYVKYGDYVPYQVYEGAEYEIPEKEFEEVIQSYFQIGREQIAANTVYQPDRQTYRYRPRGLHAPGKAYEPYPEVTAYEEQQDGTIRLIVEAVWESTLTDCAVASELVVRPIDEAHFQYVSNRVISWDEETESRWYIPRLTEEEWMGFYG